MILIGHSFGSAPITGATDHVPARISKLIYLDGAVMEDGETWFGLLPSGIAANRKRQSEQATGGGVSRPVTPAASFGVTKPDDAAFLEGRLIPHPLAMSSTRLRLANAAGNALSAQSIRCADPDYVPAKLGRDRDTG